MKFSKKDLAKNKSAFGYPVSEEDELIGCPGACMECLEGQRGGRNSYGQGHHACEIVPSDILNAEKNGIVEMIYNGNCWVSVLIK